MTLVNRIDRLLNRTVVSILKDNLSTADSPDAWWYEAVPLSIRTVVTQSQEDDKNQRGSREAYFNLIHYRDIIENRWLLLGPVFGRGKKTDRKSVQTAWLVRTNEIRKIAAHGSSGATVSLEQLNELQDYHDWLHARATEEAEEVAKTKTRMPTETRPTPSRWRAAFGNRGCRGLMRPKGPRFETAQARECLRTDGMRPLGCAFGTSPTCSRHTMEAS